MQCDSSIDLTKQPTGVEFGFGWTINIINGEKECNQVSTKAANRADFFAKAQTAAGLTEIDETSCKDFVEGIVTVAADQLKKNGSFKLAGALNLKLKKKPARPARKGINPFTKEPCVFKAKPASKTVRALPMKKLKEMIN